MRLMQVNRYNDALYGTIMLFPKEVRNLTDFIYAQTRTVWITRRIIRTAVFRTFHKTTQ